MDSISDWLIYLIPIAIGVGASFIKSPQKQQQAKPKREEPEYKYRSAADVIPKPNMKKKKKPAAPSMPEEGERAIVTEETEIIESEAEKIQFDAREAVIYSTILERKY